ncbi:cobyrinic acid a,c-diamide synthase [Candidatus Poribacteria bacterium]|nr:MAG: cobyrinic acid a,c-diamide synthase [Candidatus Poribacteria bacterium]
MKSIAVFNNKGGVGKTTLTYHLGYALAELGYKTLLIDLDPQSNLTLFGLDPEALHNIWQAEEPFIDDFVQARDVKSPVEFKDITCDVRSIHFLLKPIEDGTDIPQTLAKPLDLHDNLGMIPGRLSIHTYEDKIANRWNDVYGGDPLAIRTVTQVRNFCDVYAKNHSYDYVVIDTSPSLGILNKVIISTVDGFLIPCMPDMFSLYGIQNIGKSLKGWKRDFNTIFTLLSDVKLSHFPKNFVSFLGYTIFNAKKFTGKSEWDLSKAHHNYAKQIPATIRKYIDEDHRKHLTETQLEEPIGETAVMHSYSTRPNMAQKYRTPMWKVPSCENLEPEDKSTISGNRKLYENTKIGFHIFTKDLLTRLEQLEVN